MRDERAIRCWRFAQVKIAGLTLALAHPVAGAELANPHSTAQISVRGRVVTANGEPRPGSRVVLRASSAPSIIGLIDFHDVIAETTTDEQGRFVFNRASIPTTMGHIIQTLHNRERCADVVVIAQGYAIDWAPLYSLDNSDEITLTLHPEATLEGAVSDSEGRMLADAEVTVLGISKFDLPYGRFLSGPGELRLYGSSLRPSAATSPEGKFHIGQLPADCRIYMSVVRTGFLERYLIAAISDDVPELPLNRTNRPIPPEFESVQSHPVKVQLETGLRLQVRVLDLETNAPVTTGRVSVERLPREWKAAIGRDGTANMTVADAVYYRVSYYSAGNSSGFGVSRRVKVTEASSTSPQQVELSLPRSRWLAGRVVGQSTDTGIGRVSVLCESGASYFSRAVTTDDGRFRVAVIPGKGQLSVDGMARGFFIVSEETMPYDDELDTRFISVDVPEDGATELLTIEIPRGLSIRGTVRDANGAIPSGAVAVASALGYYGPRGLASKVDGAGEFELAGLNPREDYVVSVTCPSGVVFQTVAGEKTHAVKVPREVRVDLTLEPMVTLHGRVLLGDKPVNNVVVTFRRAHPIDDGRRRFVTMAHATTGDDGSYAFPGLQSGDEYSIDIQTPFPAADPKWIDQQTLADDAQGEVELPDVQLSRLTQTLAGIVVDPDGNAVAGAKVIAQREDGNYLSSSHAGITPSMVTGADGRFRLTQLPDQPLRLTAYIQPKPPQRTIRFPARVECKMNQQDIRILLDPSLVEDE